MRHTIPAKPSVVYVVQMRAKLRPLLIRPGARYACFGDGVCCSDSHALGPVSRSEKARVRKLNVLTTFHDELGMDVLQTRDGLCVALDAQGGCSIHAHDDGYARPAACRRFPVGLVATPDGGRVTTDHRCPCRTLGDRPLLDEESAFGSLSDAHGRLSADAHAPDVLMLDNKRSLDWRQYVEHERDWMHRLERVRAPESAFGVQPFPKIEGLDWQDAAHVLRSRRDGTRGAEALTLFGDAVLAEASKKELALRETPWRTFFERAEKRSPKQADPNAMLIDWLLDQVWSLRWVDRMTWKRAAVELTTRVHIAHTLADAFERKGRRPDVATAEALYVVEIAGATSLWANLVFQMKA